MPVDCPYCEEEIPEPEGRATAGDVRADHVNDAHADLVRAIYTGEVDDESFWLVVGARRATREEVTDAPRQ